MSTKQRRFEPIRNTGIAVPSLMSERGISIIRRRRQRSVIVHEWGDFGRATRVPMDALIRQLGITVEDVERANDG